MGNLSSRVNGKRNEIWGLVSSVMSSLYAMELENLKIRTEMGRNVLPHEWRQIRTGKRNQRIGKGFS